MLSPTLQICNLQGNNQFYGQDPQQMNNGHYRGGWHGPPAYPPIFPPVRYYEEPSFPPTAPHVLLHSTSSWHPFLVLSDLFRPACSQPGTTQQLHSLYWLEQGHDSMRSVCSPSSLVRPEALAAHSCPDRRRSRIGRLSRHSQACRRSSRRPPSAMQSISRSSRCPWCPRRASPTSCLFASKWMPRSPLCESHHVWPCSDYKIWPPGSFLEMLPVFCILTLCFSVAAHQQSELAIPFPLAGHP